MTYIPLNKEVTGMVNRFNYFAYFDFMQESEVVFITVTALDTTKQFNVYLKKNLIYKNSLNYTGLSKPNNVNYDIKGTTNKLTSAISFRVKNVPREVRENFVVRLLINVESFTYSFNQKIKILISPVINNISNLRPQQSTYYFTGFEKRYSDKTLYTLKSRSIDDDLMIIEMSACKGNFIYALVDSLPKDYEAYTDLAKRSVDSNIYSSNGKKIITVRNIEPKKEYYLLVYGANNPSKIDFIINEEKQKQNNNYDDKNKTKNEFDSEVEILFNYFTTSQKNYKYLVSQDVLNYESIHDSFGLNIKIPQLRRRDTFGRENYLNSMNYTFIVSEKKIDYAYMESTCYLTKLIQNKNHDYDYITTNLNKEENIMTVEGLKSGKTYYMNILTTNELNGEVITYKPIVFVTSLKERRLKIVGIFILTTVLLLFTIFAYQICRKYRLERAKLSSLDIEGKPDGAFKSKNINLKNYNTLSEDSESINA